MEPENGTARGDSFWIANTIILGPMLNFGSVPFIKFITCIYNIYTYTWYTFIYIYVIYIFFIITVIFRQCDRHLRFGGSPFWKVIIYQIWLIFDVVGDASEVTAVSPKHFFSPWCMVGPLGMKGIDVTWCPLVQRIFLFFFWRRKQQPAVLLTSPFDQSCHGPVTVAPGPSRVREPQFWNPPLFSRLKGSL